ncbi:MAG: hypothetical protein E6K69_08905 [Nitrospirae bacterium]|nr:MAG: hypothetical protein E6K69_08905 [Nitrospirota bacterium]
MKENVNEDRERGAALIGSVMAILLLTMLGTVSLNLATQEIESVGAARDGAVAQHLAEAGADLVVQWFHDPNSALSGPDSRLFAKQYDLPDVGASFFDAMGVSQFSGTSDSPDLLYDASRPVDDRLLNDSANGWFRSLRSLGRILKLRVYGPTRPGLLCTDEVTAGAAGTTRTLSVQLGARTIPPLRAAVQAGNGVMSRVPDGPAPVWLHWGDLKVKGDVNFGKIEELPVKTMQAPVTGQSYVEMTRREDRWLDIWLGGSALFSQSASIPMVTLPPNLYQQRDPSPGLKLDHWNYETMKHYAGIMETGLRVTANKVFGSKSVGDHHGLVFVDTLDQRPPRGDNLGTLSLETEYAEGLFVVNAHVSLKPQGSGQSVPVLSPPPEGSSSVATRVPVQLTGVHIQGVLYSAGDIVFEGRPRVYGAVMVEGRMVGGSTTGEALEVWYNDDLRSGLLRGMPLVYVAPGTWREQY